MKTIYDSSNYSL